jgi:hypothetical protein
MRQHHHQHAHREKMKMGELNHSPVRPRLAKLFLIPKVMVHDRSRREIHRVEIEHPIGEPQQEDEKAIEHNDDLKKPIMVPLSGHSESHAVLSFSGFDAG